MPSKNRKFTIDALICAFGRFGTGFLTLLLMPFYLPLLGKEAFGLFGFFMMIEVLFRIFEGGLGNAIVKDFSLCMEKKNSPQDLLRSLEVAYLSLGIVQFLLCALLVFTGSFGFLKSEVMEPAVIQQCLLIMSIRPLFSSLTIVHDAYIQASEELVALNVFRLIFSMLSSVGSIVVLHLTDGNPVAFFSWWIICSAFLTVLKACYCWRDNPPAMFRVKPDFLILKKYKKDQIKLIGVGLLAFLATKYPMWIVAQRLDLATVGVFTLASQITRTLSSSVGVMTKPLIARYTRDQARDQSGGIILLRMTQSMLLVAGIMVITFGILSEDLIRLWMKGKTFDPQLVGIVTTLLLAANFFTLTMRAYNDALQANRNVRLLYWRHFISIVIGIPISYYVCNVYGLVGLVASFAGVSGLIFFFIFPPMTQYFMVDRGVLKKLVLPSAVLLMATVILFLIGNSLANANVILRVAVVSSISALILLTSFYTGSQAIRRRGASVFL